VTSPTPRGCWSGSISVRSSHRWGDGETQEQRRGLREGGVADEAGALLFVAGATPMSSRAPANLKEICEQHLHGRYELDVVDIYQHPALARSGRVIAVPTLLKKLPSPLRRLVGDLSDRERVLVGLNLKAKSKPKPS
jgi:circadian clock protein KaiB